MPSRLVLFARLTNWLIMLFAVDEDQQKSKIDSILYSGEMSFDFFLRLSNICL